MKISTSLVCLLLAFFVALTVALPVTKTKKDKKKEESSTPATPNMETALEYERYLKEVVEALESDPEFRKKLDKADEADIRSGKIAQELDYVNHHVRTKLDEIKRREIDRLRGYANRDFELHNEIDRQYLKIAPRDHDPEHLDHQNQHTFEINDLKKLIKKTSDDLAEADRKRRAEFKEYEMQKEFERESQLKEMDPEHRTKFEHDVKEQQEKHQKHEKVHHPGNKAQLLDVWENQDHQDMNFDPNIFFEIHDVDGNGYWDETEVKALFIKELDKVYQSGLPEDDMRERAEEMERMREHVFQETDTNRDGLISYDEFLEQTKREEFNKDPEWETVDNQPQYTHEEYLQFEQRRQEEIQRMIAQGLLPPHPNMPQGYYPNAPHVANPQQQHPSGGYQQPPPQAQLHYQNPEQQHQQQQQQYQQQQQQYQQHQQPQYQGQEVNLHPNQVYQHVPAQQMPPQQQQMPQHQYQQVPQQQQQMPQQQYQQVPQQQQQQQHQQAPKQPQQQQQVPQQQPQQQLPQQPQPQQVPQQQQQPAPQQQQQPAPQQPQQQLPQQQQQQKVPQPQQQPAAAPAATINNQKPPAAQQQQIPIQQQQQQQNIPPKH